MEQWEWEKANAGGGGSGGGGGRSSSSNSTVFADMDANGNVKYYKYDKNGKLVAASEKEASRSNVDTTLIDTRDKVVNSLTNPLSMGINFNAANSGVTTATAKKATTGSTSSGIKGVNVSAANKTSTGSKVTTTSKATTGKTTNVKNAAVNILKKAK